MSARMFGNIVKWCLLILVFAGTVDGAEYTYASVLDAGSSGTKVHVYRWKRELPTGLGLPYIEGVYDKKVKPGLSTYTGDVHGLQRYLQTLVDLAMEAVPASEHGSARIYCMATAGMRLIDGREAQTIMRHVDGYLSDPLHNPFIYNSALTRILSGEEEGAFMWITVNHLRGFFTSPDQLESAGAIEQGGASLQVGFKPKLPLLANKFPVRVLGTYYPLYSHSYLTYGQNYVRLWAMTELIRQHPHTNVINHPCLLKGDSRQHTLEEDGRTVIFNGSSDYTRCQRLLMTFIHKDRGWRCQPKPCSIGSVFQPSISTHKEFYLLGSFRYTLKVMGTLEDDGTFLPDATSDATRRYCSQDFETTRQRTKAPARYLSDYCLMGTFMPMLLTKGYGFSGSTRQIKSVQKINNRTADWSLGAVIYEMERSKSWSECPQFQASSRGRSVSAGIRHLAVSVLIGTLALVHLTDTQRNQEDVSLFIR